jgi:hypothetical protein
MKGGKRKDPFIKYNISRDIDPTKLNIKALVALVKVTVTKKGTLL